MNTIDRASLLTQNIKKQMGYQYYPPDCARCQHNDADGISKTLNCTFNAYHHFEVYAGHSCMHFLAISNLPKLRANHDC
jgi:hypothetical protein